MNTITQMVVPLVPGNSISESLRSISDTLSVIAGNTDPLKVMNVDVEVGNFSVGVISLFVGVLGAIFSWLAYRFSKKTADNVVRMTADNQIALFDDMIRHLYRNLVCTLTIGRIQKERKNHMGYPSEEHLLKLKMLPEDTIHLEKYNDNKHIYTVMHELKLLLRNYDTEIDVCLMHYKNKNFAVDEIYRDLGVLSYKPFYLMTRIIEIENDIFKNEYVKRFPLIKKLLVLFGYDLKTKREFDKIDNVAQIIVSEHLSKFIENISLCVDWLKEYKYVDYCAASEYPDKGCSRGIRAFIDKLRHSGKEDVALSMEMLVSPSNENMAWDKKIRLAESDIFAPIRGEESMKGYLEVVDSPQISFINLISFALSVDVAIEKCKIRFIDINNE